jgi:hypothetical protein
MHMCSRLLVAQHACRLCCAAKLQHQLAKLGGLVVTTRTMLMAAGLQRAEAPMQNTHTDACLLTLHARSSALIAALM